jgi:Fe-Mn family superoxide dismutase
MTMTRRQALKTAALATAALSATSPVARSQTASATSTAGGPFQLPPLPYAFDALEPHIDARTMEIHHGKHHAAYVANLNKALAEFADLGKKPIEELLRDLSVVPEKVRTAIRNQGGGHYNHSLFWQMMKKGGGEPKGELAKAIEKNFGSFSSFKDELTKAALGQFGSGWAWLAVDPNQHLAIIPCANQDSPITPTSGFSVAQAKLFRERYGLPPGISQEILGSSPLVGVDVWEHAYYLKYQNRRADYLAAWFNVIDWDFVSDRYTKLTA